MSGLTDAALAADIAETAGQLLLAVREELLAAGEQDQKAIAMAGDGHAQEYIAARLAQDRPEDAVLSEEAKDDLARLEAPRVWIVDPLDGTKEFSQGRHDWAVHVALWEDGELAAGAVALPGIGETLSSDKQGDVESRPRTEGPLRFAVSRSHPSDLVLEVIRRCGGEPVPMGSAGYKVCAVIRGEVDAYVHAGGQYEWDSAAPVAVARRAGLFTSRLDGSVMRYNQREVYLPDLIISQRKDAEMIRAAADHATRQGSSR